MNPFKRDFRPLLQIKSENRLHSNKFCDSVEMNFR
jgi:hypothetical protein